MFKIKTILDYGGSYPFQIDALTIDDRMIYGRYRGGKLSVYIGESGDLSEDAAVNGIAVFSDRVGGSFSGSMTLEEFKNHTKEILDFSETVIDS